MSKPSIEKKLAVHVEPTVRPNENTSLLHVAQRKASTLPTHSMCSQSQSKQQIWLFVYGMFFVCYLVFGSIAFQQFEIDAEKRQRQEFQLIREQFLSKYSQVLGNDKK